MSTAIYYVDVSSNNGVPDLQAHWAAGYRKLMLKATEGTGYHWAQMQALANEWHSFGPDAQVGYYHWLYGNLSAADQAAFFWAQVQPVYRPGDWAMTDFEDVDPSRWVSDAQHLANVTEFDQLVGQHLPVEDYAPNWYVANMPQCIAYFKTRGVVASDYSNSPPLNPNGFNIVAHQTTDRANVAGFAAPVDLNIRFVEPVISAVTTTGGDEMSAAEVADLKAYIDQTRAAILAQIHADNAGTQARVRAFEPEVMGLRAFVRGCVTALSGQSKTLPDGTIITSVTSALLASNAHVEASVAKHVTAAAGQVDLAPLMAKINTLPAATRTELAKSLGGTA